MSGFPAVRTIEARPAPSIPRKDCGAAAAAQASRAICSDPSVPFLKPTGMDRPEASWRWIWLSVVRAPMAPQLTRSATYCGLMGSRNSVATGSPSSPAAIRNRRAAYRPGLDVVAAVQVRIVDQALPAHRGAGLFEVGPQHDQQVVPVLLQQQPQGGVRSQGRRPDHGWSRARRRRAGGHQRRRAPHGQLPGRCGPSLPVPWTAAVRPAAAPAQAAGGTR